MNIKEKAEKYVAPPKINEISFIPIDTDIFDDGEGEDIETGKTYKYSYIMWNEKSVRVPESVISQLQDQLKANPSMAGFKVTTKGEGFQKKYTVLPIMQKP